MQRVLATGWLKKKCDGANGNVRKYSTACLDESHLPQMMALQEVIFQNLQRPDLLQTFSTEFMRQHIGQQGAALGVFVDNRLVAFRNLYYPSAHDRQWNLGFDLSLTGSELNRVVNLQMVCVHPKFRGNNLALKMNRIALDLLRARNTHSHACATVSPYNIWNIPVLLDCGFVIAKLKTKYEDKLRYIVYQNLRKPFVFNDSTAERVRLDDFTAQNQLFESGFYGVAIEPGPLAGHHDVEGFDITFKKPLNRSKPLNDSSRVRSIDSCDEMAAAAVYQ